MWPLAAADVLRESDNATIWSRLHARQALVFGILATVGYLVLLALPLAVVIAVPGVSTGATVGVYVAGLLLDLAGAVFLFAVGVRAYGRAARGELFELPLVTPIVDRFFRLPRD
ncbi:MAG: hypothetical protein ABR591_04030 [Candidatus Velthaea sp.]